MPVAIVAKSRADDNKVLAVLRMLVADEPRCRLEVKPGGRPLVLWCVENADADRLLDRLSSEGGTAAETTKLRFPLCETVKDSGQGLGRIVGETGGRREYGVCNVLVEPLQPGAGFEFVDKIQGGAIPRQFIPSVERGVQTQMGRGVLAGYPLVDLRVTLLDGKAHSVDSSDMAFQKQAASPCGMLWRRQGWCSSSRLIGYRSKLLRSMSESSVQTCPCGAAGSLTLKQRRVAGLWSRLRSRSWRSPVCCRTPVNVAQRQITASEIPALSAAPAEIG